MTIVTTENKKQKYSLLLITGIPCQRTPEGPFSFDLWVRDLESQISVVDSLCLVCPVSIDPPENPTPLPSGIRVVYYEELVSPEHISRLVQKYDVIQVGTGTPCWAHSSKMSFQIAKIARKFGKCVICSISSNRAKTTLLNAKHAKLPSRLKARLTSASITWHQNRLMNQANGINLIGQGLVDIVPQKIREITNIYVGTASWIKANEIIDDTLFTKRISDAQLVSSPSLCIATRLEAMKGVHLGIEALHIIHQRHPDKVPKLAILGKGPELERLRNLVHTYKLETYVTFPGTFLYPHEFFAEIRKYTIMILTNLNDEQPRVIFDALAQGLIPICPDSLPYRSLGMNQHTLYRRGDETALADTIEQFFNQAFFIKILKSMRKLSMEITIDNMHSKRASWILDLLNRKHIED